MENQNGSGTVRLSVGSFASQAFPQNNKSIFCPFQLSNCDPFNILNLLQIIRVTVTSHYLGTLPFEHKLLTLQLREM